MRAFKKSGEKKNEKSGGSVNEGIQEERRKKNLLTRAFKKSGEKKKNNE